MKKKIDIRILAEVAIFAALGFVLDAFQGAFSNAIFVNGGSVGFAMIVVFLMTYRRGFSAGFITGLIMGFLQLTLGFYVVSDIWWKNLFQVGFDYIFAYSFCSLCCIFKNMYFKSTTQNKKILFLSLSSILGGIGKYFSHFMSGVLFWPQNSTDTIWPRIVYSVTYNGSYMIPSIILTCIIFVSIITAHPQFIFDEEISKEEIKPIENRKSHLILSISTLLTGLVMFIVFIVLSIKESSFSKEYYEYSESHLGRSMSYIVLVIIGLALFLIGIYYLIGYIKNYKQDIKYLYLGLYITSIGSIITSLSYIFTFSYKVFIKLKDPILNNYDNIAYYGIWLIFGIILLISTIILNFKYKKEI